MRLRDIFSKRKPRLSTHPMLGDWTTRWTASDRAGLPPHRPRREEDATR